MYIYIKIYIKIKEYKQKVIPTLVFSWFKLFVWPTKNSRHLLSRLGDV